MDSFRSELEDLNNPIVARDILDLEKKIRLFRDGKIDSEKFRSLRLVRGIYGQRQEGVQMVRIKLPYGRLTTRQIRRIADISDEYASSTLHATTRQDIHNMPSFLRCFLHSRNCFLKTLSSDVKT